MSATQTAPVDAAEQFLDRTTPIQRMQHMLHKYPALGRPSSSLWQSSRSP